MKGMTGAGQKPAINSPSLLNISHSSLLQMYLGSTPLMTKGPLALFFGGEPILEHLEDEPPWPGVPITVLTTLQAR